MKFSQTPTAFDPRVVLGIARMDHSAGRLSDAQRGYRTVLSLDPDEPDALHLLGVIETHLGCGEQAVELIARATQIKPEAAQYQRSLGSALKSVNRAGEAAQAFLRSL